MAGLSRPLAERWLKMPGAWDRSAAPSLDQREREYAREQAAALRSDTGEDEPASIYEAGRLNLAGVIVDDEWAEWLAYWGIRAISGAMVKDGLRDAKKDGATSLELRINSPGGNVFVAQECQLALAEFKTRDGGAIPLATVEAICASAATMFAIVAARIEIAPIAAWLVHFPAVGVFGNADDLRESADMLDRIGNGIVSQYVKRTGLAESAVREQMAKDALLFGEEAVAAGWVDAVIDTVDAALEDEPANEPEDVGAVPAVVQAEGAEDPPGADPPEPDTDILSTLLLQGSL